MWPLGQAVKTPPFHGGNRGSIPLGVTIFGPVVQLVRTPACHAGGRGFESLPDRQLVYKQFSDVVENFCKRLTATKAKRCRVA